MSTITAPYGTRMQKRGALEKANATRIGNARFRDETRLLPAVEAARRIAEVLESPEGCVCAMPMGRLLMSIERVGHQRAQRWLTLAGVRSMDRRVDELTDRQRALIATILRETVR